MRPVSLFDAAVLSEDGRNGVLTAAPYEGLPVRLVHCDPLVLHAPGTCQLCDQHGADLQQARLGRGVAFTNEDEEALGRLKCPAQAERGALPLSYIPVDTAWANRPKPVELELEKTLDHAVREVSEILFSELRRALVPVVEALATLVEWLDEHRPGWRDEVKEEDG